MIQTSVRAALGMAELQELSRDARIAVLRQQMDQLTGQPASTGVSPEDEVLELGSSFQTVLPFGGLVRRAVTECSDTPVLVAEMLAQISGSGSSVAVVGWPDLAYAAVATQGGDLSRIVAVPDPGSDPLSVVSLLVTGLDLVVFRSAPHDLAPAQARPLLGKLRGGSAALLTVGMSVPSPALRMAAQITGFRGIGEGSGRIRAIDLQVETTWKGGSRRATMTIGEPRKLSVV